MANNFANIYDNQYFSGTQAALYIGDVFVDEIAAYAFTCSTTKTPIYGYASTLFDAVSDGVTIVNGTFSLNYKQAQYLYLVLMRYKQLINTVDERLKSLNLSTDQIQQFNQGISRTPPAFAQSNISPEFSIGLQQLISGEASTTSINNFITSLNVYAKTQGINAKFDNIAQTLEDTFWNSNTVITDDIVNRVDDSYFNNFDMYFTYGDPYTPGAPHTVERILGVHLTGRAKSVTVSGEPLIEEYSFFARNAF